jgi:poly(A) polymerase
MATMKINTPPWATREGMTLLFNVLDASAGRTRIVGGAVRDTLASQPIKDIDLATSLTPEAVLERLKSARIKAVPTGLAHGTVTAVLSSGPVEVTTLRKDVATDGRHATIAYTDDWQADAARRDFTINALYADPISGEVFDWFGGIDDLAAKCVRFIGDPYTRIAEDHLRILRFFRFQARFGGDTPDADALAACCARANDLMALSRERIAMELLGILSLPAPHTVIDTMIACGIFVPVLPEIVNAAPLAQLVGRELAHAIDGDPLRRLAALLPANPIIADTIAARLKFSNAQRKRVVTAVARTANDAVDPKALAYRHGMTSAIDRLLLGNGNPTELKDWEPPRFPLTGGAIVARGIEAGPEVARIMHAVEAQWIEEGFPAKDRVETILAALMSGQQP